MYPPEISIVAISATLFGRLLLVPGERLFRLDFDRCLLVEVLMSYCPWFEGLPVSVFEAETLYNRVVSLERIGCGGD